MLDKTETDSGFTNQQAGLTLSCLVLQRVHYDWSRSLLRVLTKTRTRTPGGSAFSGDAPTVGRTARGPEQSPKSGHFETWSGRSGLYKLVEEEDKLLSPLRPVQGPVLHRVPARFHVPGGSRTGPASLVSGYHGNREPNGVPFLRDVTRSCCLRGFPERSEVSGSGAAGRSGEELNPGSRTVCPTGGPE